MITDDMIRRINKLAKKSKTQGLNEAEKAEQAALRKAYIAAYRTNLEAQLDNTVLLRPDGTREKLKKKTS